MNPNKTFKRFLKLMGFKMEDVLSTEDIISVVTSQIKAKQLVLEDVLLVFEAEGIGKGDFKSFANRLAEKNSWNLAAMFGSKTPSLEEAAQNIGKDEFMAFAQSLAKKRSWNLEAMFGTKAHAKPQAKTSVQKSAPVSKPTNSQSLQVFDDGATQLSYAVCQNKTLGIIINSKKVGCFVLALKDFARDLDINETKASIATLPDEDGRKWIVPSDEHFRAFAKDLRNINDLLSRLGGDVIFTRGAYLSSTSQANKPNSWHVRLVLPLN